MSAATATNTDPYRTPGVPALQPPPSIVGDKRQAFPCALVVFNNVRRIPGDDAAKRVLCKDEPGKRWKCTFIPAMQIFEVTFYPSQAHLAPETMYISLASVETFTLKAEVSK